MHCVYPGGEVLVISASSSLQFIAYLLESSLPVELWGHQGEKASLGGTFGGTLMVTTLRPYFM